MFLWNGWIGKTGSTPLLHFLAAVISAEKQVDGDYFHLSLWVTSALWEPNEKQCSNAILSGKEQCNWDEKVISKNKNHHRKVFLNTFLYAVQRQSIPLYLDTLRPNCAAILQYSNWARCLWFFPHQMQLIYQKELPTSIARFRNRWICSIPA